MTDMKSGGSSDDLFGEDDDSGGTEDVDRDIDDQYDTGGVSTTQPSSSNRSYLMRRKMSDGKVDFERPETITAPVREFVVDDERELQAEFDSQLVQKLQLTDLHEAAFMAALENPDLVFAKLIEMGYEAEE